MKVCLTYPPLKGPGTPMLSQNRQFQWFHRATSIYPVVLGYAFSLLQRENFSVFWLDATAEAISPLVYTERLIRLSPDIIAIEVKTPIVFQIWGWVKRIKELLLGTTVVLMGDHIAYAPRESLDRSLADWCIANGHYDFELLEICQYLRGDREYRGSALSRIAMTDEKYPTKKGKPKYSLDSLPFIDRNNTEFSLYGEKWKRERHLFYMMAARDCGWGKCSFCSWTGLYKDYSLFSPERYLRELIHLVEKYQAKEVFDDSGTFPVGSWIDNFADLYLKANLEKKIRLSMNMRISSLDRHLVDTLSKMKVRKCKIGLESANQATLDRLRKGLRVEAIEPALTLLKKTRIEAHLTVMVGFPWENESDINKTYEFVKKLMNKGLITFLQATVVMPYPGTTMYREAILNKWFTIDPEDYPSFDMTKPVLEVAGLSPTRILGECQRLYLLHFQPVYLWHTFSKMRFPRDLPYLGKGTLAMLGHLRDFAGKL